MGGRIPHKPAQLLQPLGRAATGRAIAGNKAKLSEISQSAGFGNSQTTGDVLSANCVCQGSTVDCNDNDPCTIDSFNGSVCVHTPGPDADGDGTCDLTDGCPNDPNKIAPGICGCGVADTDSDNDGTANCNDGCPNDPNKITAGICGCGVADTDSDNDGTANCNDGCPNDPNKIAPGICGCGVADTDSDGDGVANCIDPCPNLANVVPNDPCNDGNALTVNDAYNANCVCVGTPVSCSVNGDCNDNNPCTSDACVSNACVYTPLPDTDNDGTCDAQDGCPNDPNKTSPGTCGCGVADTDTDGDGTPNCNDGCPTDPNKVSPGTCGCGSPEPGASCNDGNVQTINDVIQANCTCAGSLVDCNDNNPCTADSYNGTQCVHTPLTDTDGDGTCDLTDGCPNDPNKIAPGQCGCGVADTDFDNDGTADCNDGCPDDPDKIGGRPLRYLREQGFFLFMYWHGLGKRNSKGEVWDYRLSTAQSRDAMKKISARGKKGW